MDLELTGKRALVTGGSRGIGKAIARQLALEGCSVCITARDGDTLRATASELSAATGHRVVWSAGDTADDASVRGIVASCVEQLGGVDILVNSAAMPAGQSAPPKLAAITDEAFWGDVNVKVMGYLRCAREVAPLMAAQGWGRIINISGLGARSAHSIIGSIRNVGVSALTKNLADELGPSGINVTVVHPGLTRTEKTLGVVAAQAERSGATPDAVERQMGAATSIGRIIESDEVAYVVAFLASPKSVSITGDAIACGGGQKGVIHY